MIVIIPETSTQRQFQVAIVTTATATETNPRTTSKQLDKVLYLYGFNIQSSCSKIKPQEDGEHGDY